ncbi:MAG: 4Fe-4S dicluster domain-containing protein [Candidatus Heimdallarchaeota archaeon]|nr:4Fe-4S dicluster domain-containing protein [Candidatus Heimdallarchaeota archaeon]
MSKDDDLAREKVVSLFDNFRVNTIPVQVKIEGKNKILSLVEAEKILENTSIIVLNKCPCRSKRRFCDKPTEVCLCFDEYGEGYLAKGQGKIITSEEAMAVLQKSHRAGLVHVTYTPKETDKVDSICSCCTCCCPFLGGMMKFGDVGIVEPSKNIAKYDNTNCTLCGTCVDSCPFHAWKFEEGSLNFNPNKCFGCGICVSSCPENAITFEIRS